MFFLWFWCCDDAIMIFKHVSAFRYIYIWFGILIRMQHDTECSTRNIITNNINIYIRAKYHHHIHVFIACISDFCAFLSFYKLKCRRGRQKRCRLPLVFKNWQFFLTECAHIWCGPCIISSLLIYFVWMRIWITHFSSSLFFLHTNKTEKLSVLAPAHNKIN